MSRNASRSAPVDRALVDAVTELVARAAMVVLAVGRGDLATRLKPDRSPVTAADEAAEAVILHGLRRLLPEMAVVSEEDAASRALGNQNLQSSFALVDPLDGTREFVEGRGEYTVNVALVESGLPVLGVVGAPALGTIWRGAGDTAERLEFDRDGSIRAAQTIRTRRWPREGTVALTSRSHLDARTRSLIAAHPGMVAQDCGSSLKFCRLAEGAADFYPRLAPTSEWDIAAGDAVLRAAGGAVLTPQGDPMVYGRHADFRVPDFIAIGDAREAPRIVATLQG